MKFYILAFVLLLTSNRIFAQHSVDKKPNIVLINVDDMGWMDVGFMGSKYYETPHINSLAAAGMVFTNGYAASANCAPSRASLMTGKWATRHGIYTVGSSERGKSKDRKIIPTKNTEVLDTQYQIIPKVLGKHGYVTCHAGKWHISKNPLEYGFQYNIGGNQYGHPKSYYPPYKNVDVAAKKDQYLTDAIMENTLEFVAQVEKPFFLYYAPYAVHTPIHPVKSLLDKYNNKPAWNGQNNAKYATMVENLDRNIGLLIDELKNKGVFKNTLIVFTSDNGGLYGITKQHPLRAGKGSYYEGGIREPFVFVMHHKIKPNTQSDVPITNLDIYPTILKYAGISYDESKMDGDNLSPILEGKEKTLDRSLFWHFPIYLQAYKKHNNENRDPLFRTRPGSVVRQGNWKLHYYFEDNEVELYNLSTDIGEKNNLALQMPEKTADMKKLLKKWWIKTNAPIPTVLNPDYKKENN